MSVFTPLSGPAPVTDDKYFRKADEYSESRRVKSEGSLRRAESPRPSRLARSPDWWILYISVSFGVNEMCSRISVRTLRRRVSSTRSWMTACLYLKKRVRNELEVAQN